MEAVDTVLLKQLTNSSLGSFTSSPCILRLCLKCLYLCNAGITRTNRDSLSPVQGQTLKYKASRGQRVKSSPPISQFAYQFLEILPELNWSKVHERFVTADVKGTLSRSASGFSGGRSVFVCVLVCKLNDAFIDGRDTVWSFCLEENMHDGQLCPQREFHS